MTRLQMKGIAAYIFIPIIILFGIIPFFFNEAHAGEAQPMSPIEKAQAMIKDPAMAVVLATAMIGGQTGALNERYGGRLGSILNRYVPPDEMDAFNQEVAELNAETKDLHGRLIFLTVKTIEKNGYGPTEAKTIVNQGLAEFNKSVGIILMLLKKHKPDPPKHFIIPELEPKT